MTKEEIQVRLDVLTGGINALTAMLAAIINNHPEPGRLLPAFLAYQEWATASHLNSPYGEGVALGFAELCEQLQTLVQQAQEKAETSLKPSS